MGSREVRGSAFVGRDEELRFLEAELADASAGRGRLVAIAGDPGIGKTRVMEEFIARAALPTGRVVWGPCPEHPGAPPYWPWQQAIRAYAESNDPTTVASQLGAEAADIARLVPALRRHVSGREDGAPAVESDEWRFRLFDAVTSFLRRVTDRVPLVIVLDDLHWADPASLQLLTFLARELRGLRLLLLVTYRALEVESRPVLVESLGRAARRIQLRGLGRGEGGEVIHRLTGVRAEPGMVDDIHRITEGNPFFLGELVRMLDAEAMLGRPDLASVPIRIPAELRATIRQQVAPLNDDQRRLLEVAAVV